MGTGRSGAGVRPPGPDGLVAECGRAAAGLLRRLLGDDLVAAYLVGSGALGGAAADSDVDVVAVCAAEPPDERRRALAARLTELAMTWPMRGLELVLYARAAVATPARRPRFALNLNAGPRMPHHLGLDPAAEPAHWFLLDLAILRDHGRALAGPPPAELVAPIPRRWLLEAVRDSLAWHQANEPDLQQAVLNACRGWRFAAEGAWSSKADAGAWALTRTADPATVETALAVRAGDRSRPLDPVRVRAFQGHVRTEVERALGLFETRLLEAAPVVPAPDGSAVRPLAVVSPAGSFAHFQLEPGQVARAVSHETVSEIWYVLAGTGELWRRQEGRDDETVALRPGVCLTIPLGTTFQFRAADGGEPLQVVAVTMPRWPVGSRTEARFVDGPWPATPAVPLPAMDPRMYGELAGWWPLLSAPSEYAEEAEIYRRLLVEEAGRPPRTVLELGSGGGSNASHLKAHFELTLVDLSEGMLEVSRELNPECEHLRGDMRTVRLGREFDAVFVHDAVMYMTSEDDLRQAMETAFVHCRPGGVALFAPDRLRESFRTGTDWGGHDGDGRAARFLEWTWDPDPLDTTFTVDYAYLLREADGSVRVERDRHLQGLFPRATWLRLLGETGFQARAVPVDHSELEPGTYELFVATRPHPWGPE